MIMLRMRLRIRMRMKMRVRIGMRMRMRMKMRVTMVTSSVSQKLLQQPPDIVDRCLPTGSCWYLYQAIVSTPSYQVCYQVCKCHRIRLSIHGEPLCAIFKVSTLHPGI